MDVSIIIVNYNTTEYVKKCIESVYAHTSGISYEIIVVDNFSTIRDIEVLENTYKDVKFIYKDKNNGFGAGCNYGFNNSKGKYLLFLNPDVCIVSNIGKTFFEFLEGNEKVAVCSALIQGPDSKYQYCFNDFPDIRWEILELTGYFSNKKILKLINDVKLSGEKDAYSEIDWAIGACLFVRRDIYEKVRGFDENYFLYYEDTDLQKRINELGYKIAIIGSKKILHLGKSSIENSESGSYTYFFNIHTSKLRYYKIHKGSIYAFLVRLINVNAFLLRLATLQFRNLPSDIKKKKQKTFFCILKIYLGFKNV